MKPIYIIDGAHFSTKDEFLLQLGDLLLGGRDWGHNLDAFNDVLRGGFGTPDGGFVLQWRNSENSRQLLSEEWEQSGQSLFELILEIIREHGAGGREQEDGVELQLL